MTVKQLLFTITGPQGSGKTRWKDRILRDCTVGAAPTQISINVVEKQTGEELVIAITGGDREARDAWAQYLSTCERELYRDKLPMPRFWLPCDEPQARAPSLIAAEITDLCASVFADNLAAGWWTCIHTGKSLVGKRNVGELLMLVVTELSEAADGLAGNLYDDKLPHRQMVEVELADTAIRIFDIGGGLSLDLGGAFGAFVLRTGGFTLGAQAPNDWLLKIVGCVSQAMEHHRKGRASEIAESLAMALHAIFILGEILELDVVGAIAEKRQFNRTRADHRIENRRAAGGKKC